MPITQQAINNETMAPSEFDVICGRGRSTFLHSGNKRFRQIIADHIEIYANATTRLDKSMVVSAICDTVRRNGDFVRQSSDDGSSSQWETVTERMAREKCGQGLRDFLSSKYRSSTQAKQVRRKHDLEEQSLQMQKVIESNAQIRSVLGQLTSDLSASKVSDNTAQEMFTSANSQILEELKVVSLTLPSPASLSPSSSPAPLLRDIVFEQAKATQQGKQESMEFDDFVLSMMASA